MIIRARRAALRALVTALSLAAVPLAFAQDPGLPQVPAVPAPGLPGGAGLALPPLPGGAATPSSPADFTVKGIRIEGLQRITEGTVYNYLPVNIGDHLNPQRVREALQALYATGFFSDVQMRRVGDTLVVVVKERPSIESIDIKGNKDIKTEDLNKSLRTIGLAAGKPFDRSALDGVTQALTDQYYARGKYAVQVTSDVTPLPNNRVRITINVKEGGRAKIRQIDLVGNTSFPDKAILSTLSLKTPTIFTFFKQNDRYSRETLQGDLEKIQSFFQDRGYANAHINSVQVAIAPDKKDIFITVNLTEGEVYRLGDVKLAGNLIVPEADLIKLVTVHTGQIYSQHQISDTETAIKNRLGAEGFYFAKVDPVPSIDEAHKRVNLTLFVDPGNRVYVRHINFTGTTRVNDEPLRREMRQLEAAWLSNLAIDRSKERLERLPYVTSVDVTTTPVPGSPDQADVNMAIKERSSASVGGGLGYSAYEGFMLNANMSDSDFLGSGDQISVNLDAGLYNKIYSLSETNPYTTVDGLARTVALSYSDSTQLYQQSSSFGSRQFTAGLTYGYPITENQIISAGVTLEDVQLSTYMGASAGQAVQWVEHNGHPTDGHQTYTFVNPDGTTTTSTESILSSSFNTAELSLNYVYTSLNRALFADHGVRHVLNLTYVPPGLDVRYLMASYKFSGYLPLVEGFTLSENAQVTYGKGLGRTVGLPPYKRMFAGGPDTVRGFLEDTLGPIDSNGNPYGGNLMTVAQTELDFPTPAKWQSSARLSLFYDVGNVFSTDGTNFVGKDEKTPVTYDFSYHQLKQSVGLSVEWLAPVVGLFRFSIADPLNVSRGNNIQFQNQTEYFQFTVGQSF
ncbi:MAG: outer membrane protein assembly factor BamA [Steroidobacteraceae bacterium]